MPQRCRQREFRRGATIPSTTTLLAPYTAATDLRGSPVCLGFQFVFSPGHGLRADPGGR